MRTTLTLLAALTVAACFDPEPDLVLDEATAAATAPLICVNPLGDDDGDGLKNQGEQLANTSCTNPDTDGDGISDGNEVLGVRDATGAVIFDLAAAGANPRHKDVFVETQAQWQLQLQVYPTPPRVVSAALSPTAKTGIANVYAWVGVHNPDGVDGITLHFLDGTPLAPSYDCKAQSTPSIHPAEVVHIAELCLVGGANGNKIYGVGGIGGTVNSSGPVGGRFRIIGPVTNASIYDDGLEEAQFDWMHIFVHELGHNLGLFHGGDDNLNWKPNYPGVMDYRYTPGLVAVMRSILWNTVQFSDGDLTDVLLDECWLPELHPFAGHGSAVAFLSTGRNPFTIRWSNGEYDVDWNRDGVFSNGTVKADINQNGRTGDLLHDVDDTALLEERMGYGLPGTPVWHRVQPLAGDSGTGDVCLNRHPFDPGPPYDPPAPSFPYDPDGPEIEIYGAM